MHSNNRNILYIPHSIVQDILNRLINKSTNKNEGRKGKIKWLRDKNEYPVHNRCVFKSITIVENAIFKKQANKLFAIIQTHGTA